MKRLHLTILSLGVALAINGQAATQANRINDGNGEMQETSVGASIIKRINQNKSVKPQKSAIQHDGDVAYMVVVVNAPGELSDMVNNDFCEIDSLVVAGKMGGRSDFYALWSVSFFDKLSVINLEHAQIENGEIPDEAFFVYTEQFNWMEGGYLPIKLRRIILPDNIEKIGEFAFYRASNLADINIPTSLKSIGDYAFNGCSKLKFNSVGLPEGLETIGCNAFKDCFWLTRSISIPSTVKEIGSSAFYQTVTRELTLAEGLEEIGSRAFFYNYLEEVTIPSTCLTLGEEVFRYNRSLKKAVLPEGIQSIPKGFFYSCWDLNEFSIPSTVKSIEKKAFYDCGLKSLTLPEGVETVGEQALYSMGGVEEVSFPSTLKSLGSQSCCDWTRVKKIYCAAAEPPVCVLDNSGNSPFGDVTATNNEYRTPRETPVYVPRGCARKYSNAEGWDYFTTFIETDNFPGEASVDEVAVDATEGSDGAIYDLMGRKVEHPTKGQIYISHGEKFVQ